MQLHLRLGQVALRHQALNFGLQPVGLLLQRRCVRGRRVASRVSSVCVLLRMRFSELIRAALA